MTGTVQDRNDRTGRRGHTGGRTGTGEQPRPDTATDRTRPGDARTGPGTDGAAPGPVRAARGAARPGDQQPVGELVKQASEQLSDLVRSELRLAQAEMVQKGRRAGRGGGLYGGAGLVAFLGLQAMVATGIAAIALALPVWAAALIVTGTLFVVAAVLALLARRETRNASPLKPQQAIRGLKADVEVIKERVHR
ncbi:phage holin family protein [Streptomyces sp. bgisy100]|uniref:phage holin family protein n=1 Tax=Streptomyces sp. bgisy100 TaxID=3413783 RepID=UPI003D70DCAB